MILKKLKEIYRRQDFQPGCLGIFLNPFYFNRKGLYDAVLEMRRYMKGRMLDVGCGQKPYQNLFDGLEYCGLEIADRGGVVRKEADFHYDGKVFPFGANSFDSVFSSEVLEHVFTPQAFLDEIYRVLKPGGYFLLTVPFIWDEHEQPYDYARYSSFGMAHLLGNSGFKIVDQKKTITGVCVIAQMLNGYIYKRTHCRFRVVNALVMLLIMAPINVVGQLFSLVLPPDEDLYLNNVLVGQKVAG